MRSIIAGLFIAVFFVADATAHAFLEQSNIGAGTKINAAPKALTLSFSEPLEPAFSSLTIVDAKGGDVAGGQPEIAGQRMSLPLRALTPGAYKVHWRAVSIDTHRTEGSFTFTVSR